MSGFLQTASRPAYIQLIFPCLDRKKYGFLPTDKSGKNLSSWGGSVLSEGGTWHMWAARMVNYCGIGQWEQNSQIVHATATDALGPYTELDTVAGVFAHEPCVTIDRRTGELLMVSVVSVQHCTVHHSSNLICSGLWLLCAALFAVNHT